MKTNILFILTFLTYSLFAQDDWMITLDFGNDQYHTPRAIAPAEDGSVIVTGIAKIIGTNQIFFSKIQSNGTVEFTKYHSTTISEQGEDILVLSNGNYAVLGDDPSGSYILIYDMVGDLLNIIKHKNEDASINKIIEIENGDFILAGITPKIGDPSSSPDWQSYFARMNISGETIWSNTFETDSDDIIIDAIVYEDIIIGCGFTNNFGPTDGYAIALELETGNFIWEKDHNKDVYFSDIKAKGESIFMISLSKVQETHVIEINKSGLTKRNFYNGHDPSAGISLLLGEHSTDFYIGENFGLENDPTTSKSKLTHYVDHELICEKKFKDGDINFIKQITHTSDDNIAGVIEITENGKRYTQVFKTEKICNTVSTSEEANNELEIYPNPANDFIKINFSTEKTFSVKVVNLNGTIIQENLSLESNSSIDVSSLPNGLYILQLWSDDKLMHVEKVSILR